MRYFQRRKARIEIVPMIDIMFFLLVFFIMVTLNMIPATGIGGRLPSSTSAAQLDSPQVVISLDASGTLTVDQHGVTLEQLSALLLARGADTRVVIAGAEMAALGDVVAVMDACRGAGISHVGIATREPPP
ncbi:biopolymer transporter ExbD [Rhodoferax sp. 4810]|uniref:Biopolymer transporter ExbD n=1 Tax=Thiospirillum jenense TaxID=1653858 RepID=A0A839HAG5_9GAMM|nr:biopolymer transporter ExbD [Thiospirillum jenense]MBB1075872.1 biopolymer transporter ExbD [Rhodoferax jenense]MBB1126105.1 biopolymer transporter ExbD [Thiospirillum jenense]